MRKPRTLVVARIWYGYIAKMNEAILKSRRKRSIDMSDFEEAKDKVMMGIKEKDDTFSKEEKEVYLFII